MYRNEYQFQPPHVGFFLQVLSQVKAFHVLIDETERVCLGRVHSHERYRDHIFIAEEAAYVHFIVEPLRGISDVPLGTSDRVPRRLEQHQT